MTDFGCIGVSDSLSIDPIFGLRVVGVVDFLLRVDSRLEVFEEVSGIMALTVEENVIGIVGAEVGC